MTPRRILLFKKKSLIVIIFLDLEFFCEKEITE